MKPFSPRLEDISIHAWLREHQIKTEKGELLNFKSHFFLFQPYSDLAPQQVIYKAAQVGFSTLAINKVFFIAKKIGLDIIYTMPTQEDVQTFVGGKVNRIIANNPILQKYTEDKDSVEQKRVSGSMIYFRGTFTKRAAISVTADVLIHDEEDFSDQEVIGDYDSRLQHSKYRWNWHFSHPSTIGVGVSKYWEQSSQNHWFIQCLACKKEQFLRWPDCIDEERKEFICLFCHNILSDLVRCNGRWIPKYQNKAYSGYWIPLLIAPWITAEFILKKHKEHTEEYFFNRILGLPYVGSGNKVMEDNILGCCKVGINDQSFPIIGLDTGEYLRYVIGNDKGIFYYGETKTYEDIRKLLKSLPHSIVIADQGGDIIGIRELREDFPGRVFLVHYRADRKTMQLIQWGIDKEAGNVIADRNRMIQLVLDEFKARRIILNGVKDEWQKYWTHWDHIYRVSEEDGLQVTKFQWLRSGRDDWVHATIYWRIGMSKFHGDESFVYSSNALNFPSAPTVDENGNIVSRIGQKITPWFIKQ